MYPCEQEGRGQQWQSGARAGGAGHSSQIGSVELSDLSRISRGSPFGAFSGVSSSAFHASGIQTIGACTYTGAVVALVGELSEN